MLCEEKLEDYCKEHYLSVYKYCRSRLSNKQEAEDATQDTFMIFYSKAHLIEEVHIKPWLFTTAHHMVLKTYRKNAILNDKECVFDEEITELSRKVVTFQESMIEYYMERYVDEIYARLNDVEKDLFVLCCDGNLKTGKIAQVMGLETHACSMRMKRLKEKCKDIMAEILFY